MEESKFELGPIQKKWVETLRKYPERQNKGSLGKIDRKTGEIKACCLGQGLLVAHEMLCMKMPVNIYGFILDSSDNAFSLFSSKDLLGLRDSGGDFGDGRDCLANMNDGGIPWAKIADIIEERASELFFKSV